ncbi:ATP-dependent Clp protease ATP-binding subunit ClpX, partial [Salmonella enterica subsp. enterica serovar Typhimurium]|nr:ATP-dependent Clp protease ATP-binding subunit ClpX [Salmonella enterica subsp. enterica serovar Typhimurium]
MLLSGQNGLICENCIEQGHAYVKEHLKDSDLESLPIKSVSELKKPRQIKALLDEYVIGQDQAKKQLSIAV